MVKVTVYTVYHKLKGEIKNEKSISKELNSFKKSIKEIMCDYGKNIKNFTEKSNLKRLQN